MTSINNHSNKHHSILEQALEAFQKTTGFTAVAKNEQTSTQIIITNQYVNCHFAAEVKLTLNKYNIAIEAAAKLRTPDILAKILVTRYVTPQMAEQLKTLNMPFIDTAGNAYLNEPQMFVYVKGGKLKQPAHQERVKRAFRATGLQLIFALLCKPGLENRPFRQMAQVANIALGSVNVVIRELRQMDYLIDMEKRKRQLVQKPKLLERWITAYPDQLRPKLMLGKYQATEDNWWQQTDLNPFEAYWGCEVAATTLTPYLKPTITTVYIKPPVRQFIFQHQLNKHPHGDIEILDKFWQFEELDQTRIVPPLLVYADLIATGNAKNIETAKIIYEKEIVRLIESN
jgi:hypothetical protein